MVLRQKGKLRKGYTVIADTRKELERALSARKYCNGIWKLRKIEGTYPPYWTATLIE